MTEEEKKQVEKEKEELKKKIEEDSSKTIKTITEEYEKKLKENEEKYKKELKENDERHNKQIRSMLLGQKSEDKKSTEDKEDLYSFYDNGLLETCKYFGIKVKMKGE